MISFIKPEIKNNRYKKLVIITKYFAPHSVVDSNAVYKLVEELLEKEPRIKIHIVTTSSTYKSNIKSTYFDQTILDKIKVHYTKSYVRQTQNTSIKFILGILEGLFLVLKAKRINVANIISLSNPPLIALWCGLLLRKKNFIYWTFDLYPDSLKAEGLLSEKGFPMKLFNFLTYKNSPKAILALGEKQYDYLLKKYNKKEIKKILLPCGIHSERRSELIPSWCDQKKISIGYIGNIGRAHSVEFLMNVMTAIKEREEFNLILSIYGHYEEKIMNHLLYLNANNIKIVDYLNQNELGYIDVNIVSLKPDWTNISVPSKAVSAICSSSILWFCGSNNSDTWNMFGDCSFASSPDIDSVKMVLNTIGKKSIRVKLEAACEVKKDLQSIESLATRKLIDILES